MTFMQMDNIGKFIDACCKYGIQTDYFFRTVDLYEKQNTQQVIVKLRALKDR